jgi:hypothetical protein
MIDSTLNAGGTFTTADLGTINRTGGVINITGEMDNAGAAFLSSSIGPVRLDGGTDLWGSINTTRSRTWSFTSNSNNRLSGVAVDGTLEFSGSSARGCSWRMGRA